MKLHEYCELVPPMNTDDFQRLVLDIKENGQLEKIVMIEDEILDGRNRWFACDELGIEPKTKQYRGKDPLGYVISHNVARRHLTAGQKAVFALNLLPHYEKLFPQGQHHPTNSSDDESIDNRERAARDIGVGASYVSEAKTLQTKNNRAFQALKNGEVNMREAKSMAHLDLFKPKTKKDKIEIDEIPLIKDTIKLVKRWQNADANLDWNTGDHETVVTAVNVLADLVEAIEEAVKLWQ